eukprot:g1901.t1
MFAYSITREKELNLCKSKNSVSSSLKPQLLPTFTELESVPEWWEIPRIIQALESEEADADTNEYAEECKELLAEAYSILLNAVDGLAAVLGDSRDNLEYFAKLLTFVSQRSFRFGEGCSNRNVPSTNSVLAYYCRHHLPNILGGSFEKKGKLGEMLLGAAGKLGILNDEVEDDVSINGDSSEDGPTLNQILVDPSKYFPGVTGIAWYCGNIDLKTVTHSCLPNSEVVSRSSVPASLELSLKWRLKHSTPDEASGTSLCFIPRNLPYESRQYYLAEIGIQNCECPLCMYEKGTEQSKSKCGLPLNVMKDLAILAQEDGRHSDAINIFRNVLAVTPNDPECLYGLSRVLSWDDRWHEGHLTLLRASELVPDDKTIMTKRAEALSYYPYHTAFGKIEEGQSIPSLDAIFDTVIEKNVFKTKSGCPLIPPKICSVIVETVEHSMKGKWATSRHYAVPTTDVPVRDVATVLPIFNSLLKSYLFPALAHLFNQSLESLRIVDAFIVKYNAEKQRSLPVHCDQSQFSFTVALNDQREYEGGGLYLANSQSVINVDSGGVVCFTGTTEHGGFPLYKGNRYIIAVFAYSTDSK